MPFLCASCIRRSRVDEKLLFQWEAIIDLDETACTTHRITQVLLHIARTRSRVCVRAVNALPYFRFYYGYSLAGRFDSLVVDMLFYIDRIWSMGDCHEARKMKETLIHSEIVPHTISEHCSAASGPKSHAIRR